MSILKPILFKGIAHLQTNWSSTPVPDMTPCHVICSGQLVVKRVQTVVRLSQGVVLRDCLFCNGQFIMYSPHVVLAIHQATRPTSVCCMHVIALQAICLAFVSVHFCCVPTRSPLSVLFAFFSLDCIQSVFVLFIWTKTHS